MIENLNTSLTVSFAYLVLQGDLIQIATNLIYLLTPLPRLIAKTSLS